MNVLVVNKNGTIEEHDCELDLLYELCEYKTNKDFEKVHSYDNYEIYGKTKGKPDNENKYIFPNINKVIYGKACIVKQNDIITIDEWSQIYDILKNETELAYEDYESE